MFVLTVDQRRSRRDVDRVGDLLADYRDRPLLRPFERTAGDEVQAVTDDPAVVVDLALDLVRRGQWSVGIGVGPVREPLPDSTRAGHGPAFEYARDAVTRAKRAPARLAVTGSGERAADPEAVLTLLGLLVARRSAEGQAVVDLLHAGRNQSVVADTLGITKQAVSQRLAAAGWHAEGPARTTAARLLREADEG